MRTARKQVSDQTHATPKTLRPSRVQILVLPLMLAGILAGGCADHRKTDREEGKRNWNVARANVLASLAKDQYTTGNFDKARETVDQALKLNPQNEQLHILSAKLAIEQGQLEVAERELTVSRQLVPNDAEAYYLSGVCFQRWQRPQAAYDLYHTARTKAPGELSYLMAEAEMLVSMDRGQEAMRLLQEKVTYFENSASIRDAVGQLLMQQGKYADAVAMFRQATILAEDDQSIRERLAMALYYNKEYREAGEIITKLVQNETYSKRADLFNMLGECQVQQGKMRDARSSFESATQLSPDDARTWQRLGRAALECGDYRRAEIALRKSVNLDASVSETHLLIGYVKLRQGKLNEALTCFEKSNALDHNDTVSLCMIGYAFEKLGKPDTAMRYYARALKMRPGDDLASQLMAGVDLHDHR